MIAIDITLGSAPPSNFALHLSTRRPLRSTLKRALRRSVLLCRANESSVPSIHLKFQTAEGPTSVDCESGDILRDVMLEKKVDLYTTWGKVWTCGGGGQCGTCVVKVIEGSSLLSDRNATEQKKLKRKPESYRLACQTNVGSGTNTGTISLQTKPP